LARAKAAGVPQHVRMCLEFEPCGSTSALSKMAGYFSLKSRLAFPSQHLCSGGGTAMDKPIRWWRAVDALMIVGSSVIIVVGIWIAY
jgi:hypothetical protein